MDKILRGSQLHRAFHEGEDGGWSAVAGNSVHAFGRSAFKESDMSLAKPRSLARAQSKEDTAASGTRNQRSHDTFRETGDWFRFDPDHDGVDDADLAQDLYGHGDQRRHHFAKGVHDQHDSSDMAMALADTRKPKTLSPEYLAGSRSAKIFWQDDLHHGEAQGRGQCHDHKHYDDTQQEKAQRRILKTSQRQSSTFTISEEWVHGDGGYEGSPGKRGPHETDGQGFAGATTEGIHRISQKKTNIFREDNANRRNRPERAHLDTKAAQEKSPATSSRDARAQHQAGLAVSSNPRGGCTQKGWHPPFHDDRFLEEPCSNGFSAADVHEDTHMVGDHLVRTGKQGKRFNARGDEPEGPASPQSTPAGYIAGAKYSSRDHRSSDNVRMGIQQLPTQASPRIEQQPQLGQTPVNGYYDHSGSRIVSHGSRMHGAFSPHASRAHPSQIMQR